jgi:5-methylcytosine-specific restriction protein A
MARTHGHGNPSWTKDETVLALDLYFRCKQKLPSSDDPQVIGLSNFLRHLPYHTLAARKESFRNPAGVVFKLQNLRQVATGKGLGNVSHVDRSVWADFGGDEERVKSVAALIREGAGLIDNIEEAKTVEEKDEFFEGRILTEVHMRRERHPNIRKSLLKSRRVAGRLACDMCGCHSYSSSVVFEDATFEAHHLVPISKGFERMTRVFDMALLCANCHRLLHRAISISKRWLNINEAKQIISDGARTAGDMR